MTNIPRAVDVTLARITGLVEALTKPTRDEYGKLIPPRLELAYAGIYAWAGDGYPSGNDSPTVAGGDMTDSVYSAVTSIGRADHADIEQAIGNALYELRKAEGIINRYMRQAPDEAAARYDAMRCKDRLGGYAESWADPTCERNAVHPESGLCHPCYVRWRRYLDDDKEAAA